MPSGRLAVVVVKGASMAVVAFDSRVARLDVAWVGVLDAWKLTFPCLRRHSAVGVAVA